MLPQRPPPARPARGCDIATRHLGARLNRFPLLHIFDANEYPVWQGGYVQQGELHGAQLSRFFNGNREIAGVAFGPGVGLEVAGGFTDAVAAPYLSYEVAAALVGGRLDVAYYLSQSLRGDLRLTPQIGLCPLGVFNIYYGYAIPVAGSRIEALGSHRLTIYLNLIPLGKIGG